MLTYEGASMQGQEAIMNYFANPVTICSAGEYGLCTLLVFADARITSTASVSLQWCRGLMVRPCLAGEWLAYFKVHDTDDGVNY
jgi:hypothetical protein